MPKELKHHRLIVGLLITILILSLVAVALIVNVISKQQPANTIADICGEEVTTAVQQRANELTAACDAQLLEAKKENNQSIVVKPSNRRPGFSYPSTWAASGREVIGDPDAEDLFLFQMNIGPAPIVLYEPSERVTVPVQITTLPKKSIELGSAISYEAYLYTQYEAVQNLVIASERKNNGTVYMIKGEYLEGVTGPFEQIEYVTDTHVVSVYFGPGMWEDQRAGWEMIKSSLDFSLIE